MKKIFVFVAILSAIMLTGCTCSTKSAEATEAVEETVVEAVDSTLVETAAEVETVVEQAAE